jgi:hypothetical protein
MYLSRRRYFAAASTERYPGIGWSQGSNPSVAEPEGSQTVTTNGS